MPNTIILKQLRQGYQARQGHGQQQKSDWEEIVSERFPPVLSADQEVRPNVLLAEQAGDLGMALLWIVQAALFRPCLDLFSRQDQPDSRLATRLKAVGHDHYGALAHSEDQLQPFIVDSAEADELVLRGTKKYITGGKQADSILVTARRPEENKVSQLIWLPAAEIQNSEMRPLDPGALLTISHGRLVLTSKRIPGHYRLPLTSSQTRRYLMIWGMIERGLILEAFIGLLKYLNLRLSSPSRGICPVEKEELARLSRAQQTGLTGMIQEALADVRVTWRSADLSAVGAAGGTIIQAGQAYQPKSETLQNRLNDAGFIQSRLSIS